MNLLAAALAVLLVATGLAGTPARADWLTRVLGAKAVSQGADEMERLARHVKAASSGRSTPVLGAVVSQEGHWTFVSPTGEKLTAANADEMRRVTAILTGDGDPKPNLVLAEDTVFRHREHLKSLANSQQISVLVADRVYPLVRRGDKLMAEVRPAVAIEVGDHAGFEETVYQLARPIARADIRVLSLAIDGPETLRRRPLLDSAGKPQTDLIDPYRLPMALSALAGQTAVVIGRIDGVLLNFRLPNGSDRGILLADLIDAAARHDVNLVVLQAQAARQPGTRNWLWQRIEVAGLDAARERTTFADFLDAFAAGNRATPIVVAAAAHDTVRTRLALTRPGLSGGGGVGDFLADLTSEVTGRVVTASADAYMVSSSRQRELALRLVPGIPSALQWGYGLLAVAGLVGLPLARRWWTWIWPPENRAEYAGAAGYHAARTVKFLAFVLLFLPSVGLPAAVLHLARQTLDVLLWPFRLIGTLIAGSRRQGQSG